MPSDPLQSAALLGNILALPQTFEQRRREAEQSQVMLQALGQATGQSYTPEQLNTLQPLPPTLGTRTPYVGGLLRGVGTVGQVLQAVTGSLPAAPRPPVQAMSRILELQGKVREGAARERLAAGVREKVDTRELGARAVEAGIPATGVKLAAGGGKTPNEIGLWAQALGYDPHNLTPEQSGEVARQIDVIRTRRAGAMGAAATAGRLGVEFSPQFVDAEIQRKLAIEAGAQAGQQRIRSAGALGFLRSLRGSVDRKYTATDLGQIPVQAGQLYVQALQGDADAVNIQTAQGRLPVLVEALQRDGRISNQDAIFLMGNLPSFYDTKARAIAKLDAIEDTLRQRNINLDTELGRMGGGAPPAAPAAQTPAPATTTTTVPGARRTRRLPDGRELVIED